MSWIKEPGEHVKLIRNRLAELQAKIEEKVSNSKAQHLDEISAVRNIFYEDRCLEYSEGHLDIEIIFNIDPVLSNKEIQASYIYEDHENLKMPFDFGSLFLENLPPIRLYLKFPTSYPQDQPPEYTLDIPWLTPWDSSKICQKLDELWAQNAGSEILYIWINFLKNHLFTFLQIQETLDISFHFAFFKNKSKLSGNDTFFQEILRLKDPRVSNPSCQCPVEFLNKFDKTRRIKKFEENAHFCDICLQQTSGINCDKLKNCGHIFCKNCLEQYLSFKISEGGIVEISCPKSKCEKKVEFEEIKESCDKETFAKFEHLLLQKTINTMKDVVPCARKLCQYPVIRENLEDNLVICTACKYSFCVYCRKGYHGVSPCKMSIEEKEKLITQYQNASAREKKELELRYGKKQINIIVERHLTLKYMKENTKQCPNCLTPTSKVQGCNKMTCCYCQENFCWLCCKIINSKNPYQHFGNGSCAGLLFDGINMLPEPFDIADIQANLNFFRMRN